MRRLARTSWSSGSPLESRRELRAFRREIVGLLLDAFAEREANEADELELAADLLPELLANRFDGALLGIPNVLLAEERDLGEPLGDLAVEDLPPRGRRRLLGLFLHLRVED